VITGGATVVEGLDKGVEIGFVLERKEDIELDLLRGADAFGKDSFVGGVAGWGGQDRGAECRRKEEKMFLRKVHGKASRGEWLIFEFCVCGPAYTRKMGEDTIHLHAEKDK
jgi:hypothetical protein